MLYLLYAYWKLTYFDGLNCSTGSNAPMAISSLTVSYTHLDVYKRQKYGCYV